MLLVVHCATEIILVFPLAMACIFELIGTVLAQAGGEHEGVCHQTHVKSLRQSPPFESGCPASLQLGHLQARTKHDM